MMNRLFYNGYRRSMHRKSMYKKFTRHSYNLPPKQYPHSLNLILTVLTQQLAIIRVDNAVSAATT